MNHGSEWDRESLLGDNEEGMYPNTRAKRAQRLKKVECRLVLWRQTPNPTLLAARDLVDVLFPGIDPAEMLLKRDCEVWISDNLRRFIGRR